MYASSALNVQSQRPQDNREETDENAKKRWGINQGMEGGGGTWHLMKLSTTGREKGRKKKKQKPKHPELNWKLCQKERMQVSERKQEKEINIFLKKEDG